MGDENWATEADKQEDLSRKVQGLSMRKDLYRTVQNFVIDKKDENYEKVLSSEEHSLLRKLLQDKLVQSNQELDIQQRDPTSPLYSVKSFEELRLNDDLLKGIYAMGFNRPSKIQETALPLLLANPPENMIAQSQSGTGKTAAFVLTMLSRIKTDLLYPQCLCLSPTYELALQTGKVVESMGKFLSNLKVAYAVRGNKGKNTSLYFNIIGNITIDVECYVIDMALIKLVFLFCQLVVFKKAIFIFIFCLIFSWKASISNILYFL